MTNIRRYYIPDTPVFITAVCYKRQPILAPAVEKERLLTAMRDVREHLPFVMLGYTILNDHFHWLIKPKENQNFSHIMQSVKLRYTHRYKQKHGISAPVTLWQRRFWDHTVRDEDDHKRHLDYIHYNSVKHEYVDSPDNYPWSSYHEYVERGYYPPNWAKRGIQHLSSMELE
jgi:putative transposase